MSDARFRTLCSELLYALRTMSRVTESGIFDSLIERAESEINCVDPGQDILGNGEYVLATEWPEGDPEGRFAIGFIESYCQEEGCYKLSSSSKEECAKVYYKGDSKTPLNCVKFRKVEKIAKEEGLLMFFLLSQQGNNLKISLWNYLDRVKDKLYGQEYEVEDILQDDLNFKEGFNEGWGQGYTKGKFAGWVQGYEEGSCTLRVEENDLEEIPN